VTIHEAAKAEISEAARFNGIISLFDGMGVHRFVAPSPTAFRA